MKLIVILEQLQWLQREILEFLNLGPVFPCFTVKLLIHTKMH